MQKITRYSLQPRDQIFLKGGRVLSFAKNMSKTVNKNVSGKCSQKSLDHAKQCNRCT